jgi:predicted ester cyclase
MYKTAFPDMSVTIEDVVAEGDKVVTRVTLRGTHQGEGGKIVEEWNSYDTLSFMQQLGLVPEQQ